MAECRGTFRFDRERMEVVQAEVQRAGPGGAPGDLVASPHVLGFADGSEYTRKRETCGLWSKSFEESLSGRDAVVTFIDRRLYAT